MGFRFTEFEIDVARQELRRAGEIVHIEPQVFDLLVHLLRNRDRIVGKDELIETVWQGRIVSEATLSSRISAARRALGDSGNDQTLIRTLYKRGFRFVGHVDDTAVTIERTPSEVVGDATNLVPAIEPVPLQPAIAAPGRPQELPDRVPRAATVDAATTGASAPRTRLAVAAIGLIVSLLIAVWWLLTWGSPSLTASTSNRTALASDAQSSPDRLKTSLPSIVVLPFANLSGDASQDYFADGISDSLISDLVRALPGMPVVSRDTAFTYKGRNADARQIRRELGVRYLLEGSVVPEGARVRVNARLVETKEGSQLWSERFDAERKSILDVQDEIVGRVSRAIGLKVIAVEAQRSWRERPGSAEDIDLIMRGKAALNLPSSAATMIEARELFEQALKVQPDNVDGLAGVAATLVFEFLNGYYETGGDERLRRAESLLDRAVMIEPRHLVALKAKAALHRTQGKFDDAIAAAQAVIMENPGEPWAYKEIGLSNLYLGRPEPALGWFAKADRIGPRDPGRWTWLDGRGHALILLGRDQDAIHALVAALDANPKNRSSHGFLAAAYALSGQPDEARAALAVFLQRRPGTTIATFRSRAPVPLALTSPKYREQHERLKAGLRQAGMPE